MTAYKTRGRLVWTVELFALHHAVRMYKTYFSVLHAYHLNIHTSPHINTLAVQNTLF